MAQPIATNQVEKQTAVQLFDQKGRLIVALTDYESTTDDQQILRELHCNQTLQLVDGVLWTQAMASGSHPVLLARCALCIKPPTTLFGRMRASHGLLSTKNARVCVSCGAITCPTHRRLTGESWRCLRCARWSILWRLLRPIFVEDIED